MFTVQSLGLLNTFQLSLECWWDANTTLQHTFRVGPTARYFVSKAGWRFPLQHTAHPGLGLSVLLERAEGRKV